MSVATTSSEGVLDQFVQRAKQLYTLPAVALRVMELTRNEPVDVRELQQCVAGDPALTGKLLRVVNSSVFGLHKPVGDLRQAISLLGIQRLKLLVLGFSLPVHSSLPIQPAVLERYWRHALIKSVTARDLAESLWRIPGDEAFIAGLLEDLGQLVLVQDLGDSYIKFLHGVWSTGNDPRAMQVEILGFDHVQLSARLLESWGLPPRLLQAIAAPRNPQQIAQLERTARSLPQVLHLAELITRFLLDRQVRWLDELLDVGDAYLGLKIEQLYAVLARVEQATPELAAALSIPWTDSAGYVALLEQVHQRQSEAMAEAAAELMAPPLRPREILATNAVATASDTTSPAKISAAGSKFAHAASILPPMPPLSVQLLEQLDNVVSSCRQSRLPISLLLVELDDRDGLVARFGAERVERFLLELKLLIQKLIDANLPGWIEPVAESRLGAVLTGTDRQAALNVARQILDGFRKWADRIPAETRHPSVSIGLASLNMPPRNFPASDLLQAAERCLNGVKLSGGNGMKSIELY